MPRYFGEWGSIKDVHADDWSEGAAAVTELSDSEVLFAHCDGSPFDAEFQIVFRRGDAIYEATGNHCSCGGFSFVPGVTSWAALAMRKKPFVWTAREKSAARDAWAAMIARHVPTAGG